MSRRVEYVNPAGLRLDGRRPRELRDMQIEFGVVAGCDGSCMVQLACSKICVSVYGPREVSSRQDAKSDEALLSCEVVMGAFAGQARGAMQRHSRLADEMGTTITQVMRSVVLREQYPGSQIHVLVDVLQQDGSEKVTCITAACLALTDANIAMRDMVSCVNVGIIDDTILVDLTADELRSQCVTLAAAFLGHGTHRIVWLESTSRLSSELVARLVAVAQQAGQTLFASTLEPALRARAEQALKLNV